MLRDAYHGSLNRCNDASLVSGSERWTGGLLRFSSEDLEEEGEDVDDVEVNVERGEDVLLWTHGVALVPHEELGVKCQKLKQRTKQQVRQLHVSFCFVCCAANCYF